MSDLIAVLTRDLAIDEDMAVQGAGAIFSVIKERVGLRTFQMLKVPFPEVEAWIDRCGAIEGYGGGDFFLQDGQLSGPAVDIMDRATAAGVELETAQKMFALVFDAIQREAIEPVAQKVAERVPAPTALKDPKKKRIKTFGIFGGARSLSGR
jgi:hypothetical protein